MKQFLFFLICGMLVYSCTITKRHFGNGYHVEWNRKIKTGTDREEKSKMEFPENQLVLKSIDERDSLLIDQTESTEQVAAETNTVIETKELGQDQIVQESPFQSEMDVQKEPQIKTDESSPVKETDDEAEETPKRRMHPLMWGLWAMWSIAIAFMFFVTFYAEFLIGVALGFFIAMIFALIVLRSLRKNPVKQPFKGLSYGFGIPAIVFGVIASAGVGLILVIFFFA